MKLIRNPYSPISNPIDILFMRALTRVFVLISKVTGYSAKQQSKTAFWLGESVYAAHGLNFIRTGSPWGIAGSLWMMILIYATKSHIWKMGELSMQLPDQERAWARELSTRQFLRTAWGLLITMQFPLDLYRLIFERFPSPNIGLWFVLYAMYVSIMPGGRQQSLYSKAKDKLKELSKAIQPQPRLIPLPVG